MPEIGVRVGSPPGLRRADLPRWLDDFAFSGRRALESALQECGRSPAELASALKSASWKRALARKLRDAASPPYRWLAEELGLGKPGSVCAYLHDQRARAGNSDSRTDPVGQPPSCPSCPRDPVLAQAGSRKPKDGTGSFKATLAAGPLAVPAAAGIGCSSRSKF